LEIKKIRIKLAIAVIALETDFTKIWKDRLQALFKELDAIAQEKEVEFTWAYREVLNKPRHIARQEITESIIKDGFNYLFFIDSDTFIPQGAIRHILQLAINQDYKVVCLPVYLKRMPLVSNIFEDLMFVPLAKLPRTRFKIDFTGLAAVLIDLEVFTKIQSPYYEGEWKVIQIKDVNFHLKTGEDTAFFYKLKRAGIDVWCEPKFICEHYDAQKDIFFPALIGNKELCYEILS